MWLFTTDGFISAVFKDGALQVRARDKDSLKSLANHVNASITSKPLADYPYRISTTNSAFADWVSTQALEIDYGNFKSEVAAIKGYEFARPLNRVWDVMHQVEYQEARVR